MIHAPIAGPFHSRRRFRTQLCRRSANTCSVEREGKAWDEALARGWTVGNMKDYWNTICPSPGCRETLHRFDGANRTKTVWRRGAAGKSARSWSCGCSKPSPMAYSGGSHFSFGLLRVPTLLLLAASLPVLCLGETPNRPSGLSSIVLCRSSASVAWILWASGAAPHCTGKRTPPLVLAHAKTQFTKALSSRLADDSCRLRRRRPLGCISTRT